MPPLTTVSGLYFHLNSVLETNGNESMLISLDNSTSCCIEIRISCMLLEENVLTHIISIYIPILYVLYFVLLYTVHENHCKVMDKINKKK